MRTIGLLSHGDSPIVAVRRAIQILLGSPLSERKKLGVVKLFINGKWEDFPVDILEPGACHTATPAPGYAAQVKPEPRDEP